MRLIIFMAVLLCLCGVTSCNEGKSGSSNSAGTATGSNQALGDTIIYPEGWPAEITLPTNCKPYRTRLVAKLAEGKVSNVSVGTTTVGGGVIQIGFEFPDGWKQLISHFDSVLLAVGYTIDSNPTGDRIDYILKQGDKFQFVRVNKELRSDNYYNITYSW